MPPDEAPQIEIDPQLLAPLGNEGALAAMNDALEGKPAPEPAPDPQPGDPIPPPDGEAPAVPEGDGATDPDDNAPATEPPKPDDKKTVEPTAPEADDLKVEPDPEGGMRKRPSDEFGELPATVSAKTRERFDAMRGKYDELHGEREAARASEQKWIDTVQSTGATPQQFGATLSYLQAVNSGTKAGMEAAYEMMSGELATLGKALGREVPGYDPLTDHPDLLERVERADLERADALELAQARAGRNFDQATTQHSQSAAAQQAETDAGLAAVSAFGLQMKATDPNYVAKTAAMKPLVERVVSAMPPSQWAAAIKDIYDNIQVAAPVPAYTAPIRPTSSPSNGAGVTKAPGSAREAVDAALANM